VGDGQPSPVKYHYFHSFFTDSVKWKAGLQRAHTSCIEASVAVASAASTTARSPPRTVSGGEFDWGGTSVKR
jgi:hypothetical protein